MRSLLGKLVHVLQFRRPLMSIFDLSFGFVTEAADLVRAPPLVSDEILACLLLLPLAFADLRTPFYAHITASDASPTGGGSCESVGLSAQGMEMLNRLEHGEGVDITPSLLITFNDPLGAGRQATHLLGIVPMAFVALEDTKVGRKVLKEAWPDVRVLPTQGGFTDLFVQTLRQDYPKVQEVLFVGRVDPRYEENTGFVREAHRLLSQHITWRVSVAWWLEHSSHITLFKRWARGEGLSVLAVDGLSVGWVASNAMVAFNGSTPPAPPGCLIQEVELSHRTIPCVICEEARPPVTTYLVQAEPEVQSFSGWPPFPISSPRLLDDPPSDLHSASVRARNAAQGDAWRLPLHCYELGSQVRDVSGLRYLSVQEQLQILGFAGSHLQCSFKQLGRKVFQDVCRNLLAQTVSAFSLAVLLSSLLRLSREDPLLSRLWQAWQVGKTPGGASGEDKSWRQRFVHGGSSANETMRSAALLVQHSARACYSSRRGSPPRYRNPFLPAVNVLDYF